VKAVLLDLDDTLLDYSSGAEQCWAQACAAGASTLDQTVLLAELGQARRWFWSDPERHRRERTDMLRAWTTIVAHALERCGVADPRRAAAVAEDFGARRGRS
jgi:putative hydrolase of the HAD superfamily